MRTEQRKRLDQFASGQGGGHWQMRFMGHRFAVLHMPLGVIQGEPEHWLFIYSKPGNKRQDGRTSVAWEIQNYGSGLGCSSMFPTAEAARDEVLRRVAAVEADAVARKSGGNVIAFPLHRTSPKALGGVA